MSTITTTTIKGDSAVHRHFGENLARELASSDVLLLTTLPRGGLQLVQPHKVSESFLKAHSRQWHSEDDVAWAAITTGMPVRGELGTRYLEMFLGSFGFKYVAAVCVKDPVLPGYCGALEAHRTENQGGFSSTDLEKLVAAAQRIEGILHQARATRGDASLPGWLRRPSHRQFVLNAAGEVIAFKAEFEALNVTTRQLLIAEAKARLANLPAEEIHIERLLVPDDSGDYLAITAAIYRAFPSLNGPVAFFSILPSAPEWSLLRAEDFQADTEISRMIPALRFMQQEYHRGPSLTEIASTVRLSPFHFHRRFTELFGLTPKHFLLESQVFDAKRHLFAGEKELVNIASECGFAHQSHFTSRFKQATGLTPTRWRKTVRSTAGL